MRTKEHHFALSAGWLGERRVAVRVEGKPAIEVMPPPVFRGTDPSAWSPEDFLVAAAASCLAVTFTGLAAADGRFGFTRLLLRLQVETEHAEEARRLAKQAEETCLVSASLDLPVETRIELVAPAARDRTHTRTEMQLASGRAPASVRNGADPVPGRTGGRESC